MLFLKQRTLFYKNSNSIRLLSITLQILDNNKFVKYNRCIKFSKAV